MSYVKIMELHHYGTLKMRYNLSMIIYVNEIKEKYYEVHIDLPEKEADELYEELSCEPCMDDIDSVMDFLEDKGISAKKYHDEDKDFDRIETWR